LLHGVSPLHQTFLKSFSNDVTKISCVAPETYANRFVAFLKEAMD